MVHETSVIAAQNAMAALRADVGKPAEMGLRLGRQRRELIGGKRAVEPRLKTPDGRAARDEFDCEQIGRAHV